jgi:hemerythrin-like domain-containing protein
VASHNAPPPDQHADPVLRLLDDLTREGTVVAAFQATHDKFRQYHADCLQLTASATPDDRAVDALVRCLDAYAELFNDHHMAEEDYLFPALHRVEPALDAVVAQLGIQHEKLGAQLAVVLEQAQRLHSGAVRGKAIPSLVEELTTLQAVVEEHLLFEETTTIPVVGTWTSWPL